MSEAVNDAPPLRKKMSGLKIAGVVALSIFGVLLLTFLWMSIVGNRRFAEMEASLREMQAVTAARDAARPVLRGTAVPGNAWADYGAMLTEMEGLKADRSVIGEFVSKGPKADRAKVEAILAAHPGVIERLRMGAGKSSGQYAYVWEDGFTAKTPGLFSSGAAGNMAISKARFLAEEGKLLEAAELLLDSCQFGRDLGHNAPLISEMIAMAVYGTALEELRALLTSARFAPEEFREIGRQLEVLDASFPSHADSLLNEALGTGWGLRQIDRGASEVDSTILFARSLGGVGRLMYADAFDSLRYCMRTGAQAESRPWADCLRIQTDLQNDLQRMWNPISKTLIPGLIGSGRIGRDRRTQIRLLRIAARFRADGEVLVLDDPFGVSLHSVRAGDHLKIWSVGRDGADDAGVGDWNPNKGRDIVLEVDR